MIWMYVGTYTKNDSRGIYGVALDGAAGTFGEPKLMAETPNPSYLALTEDGKRLYAACDPGTFEGKPGGGVAAFSVDAATRALKPLGTPQKTGGGNCFVGVTPDNAAVLAADYGAGTVAVVPTAEDGSLRPVTTVDQHEGHGPVRDRQEKAHAHSAYADPAGRYALSCDLGSDEIYVYRINHPAGLTRHAVVKVSPGAGPRHLAFSPDNRFVYVVNELGNSVDAFRWDERSGTLTHLQQTSTLPADFHAFSKAAEIAVHGSGAFVYASNRGHDSIALFHVDRDTGLLSAADRTPVGGRGPRHFGIDSSGRWLVAANEETDNLVAFRIDPQTGTLTKAGETRVSRPVCVVFPHA